MIERPSRDSTLMATAMVWQERSSCARNQVGAVIAMNGRVVSTGYNGAPPGMAHCNHGNQVRPFIQLTTTEGCRVAIHAEANAIAHAARHGVTVLGGEVYTTLSPCYECAKLIIAAGLARVVYDRPYRDRAGLTLLTEAGVAVEQLNR